MTNRYSNESDSVLQLLRECVPEVASGVVEVMGIVRDPGSRCALAVRSKDPAVDPVGACSERLSRIAALLGGEEHFDVYRWSESLKEFIGNMLAGHRIVRVWFNEATHEAAIRLAPDSKRPWPKRFAMQSKLLLKLTGWRLKLELPNER